MNIENSVLTALEEIRPFLNRDGGDVELVEITHDMVVKVAFTGACKTCHMNTMTFATGVEEAIKRNVPEVKKVISV